MAPPRSLCWEWPRTQRPELRVGGFDGELPHATADLECQPVGRARGWWERWPTAPRPGVGRPIIVGHDRAVAASEGVPPQLATSWLALAVGAADVDGEGVARASARRPRGGHAGGNGVAVATCFQLATARFARAAHTVIRE